MIIISCTVFSIRMTLHIALSTISEHTLSLRTIKILQVSEHV